MGTFFRHLWHPLGLTPHPLGPPLPSPAPEGGGGGGRGERGKGEWGEADHFGERLLFLLPFAAALFTQIQNFGLIATQTCSQFQYAFSNTLALVRYVDRAPLKVASQQMTVRGDDGFAERERLTRAALHRVLARRQAHDTVHPVEQRIVRVVRQKIRKMGIGRRKRKDLSTCLLFLARDIKFNIGQFLRRRQHFF